MKTRLCAKAILSLALTAAFLMPAASPSRADTDAIVQSYEEKLGSIQQKKEQLTQELIEIHEQKSDAWYEMEKLDQLVNLMMQQKKQTQEQLDLIAHQIDEKKQAIVDTTARIEAQEAAFYDRMVDNYMEKETDYIELILGSESLRDFLTKVDYVTNILKSDRTIIAKLESDRELLAQDQAILEKAEQDKVDLVSVYEEAITNTQLLYNSKEALIEELQQDEARAYGEFQYASEQAKSANAGIERRLQEIYLEEQQRAAEARRLEAEEAERQRIAAEQAELQRQAAAEAERLRQEALAEEERQRQAAEEAERQRLAAEAEAKFAAEEAERKRLEAEAAEMARQKAEAEAAQAAAAEWAAQQDAAARQAEQAAAEQQAIADTSSQWILMYQPEETPQEDSSGGFTEDPVYDAGQTEGYTQTGGARAWTWSYGDGYDQSYTADGTDAWSNFSYVESYKQYYVYGEYVGGEVSFPLDPSAEYETTSEAGWRMLFGQEDYHMGIDLSCDAGTQIRAYNAGTVVVSEYHYSYGNYVIVNHGGGLATLYAHMSERAVSAGDWVESGDTLGYVGMTGSAYGYHLHFEVRLNGAVQNPREYMEFKPLVQY